MSKNLTNSINHRRNTKSKVPLTQSPVCTVNEYVNEIQKVPEQNFGAFEDH